jgi:hypothetical protein
LTRARPAEKAPKGGDMGGDVVTPGIEKLGEARQKIVAGKY